MTALLLLLVYPGTVLADGMKHFPVWKMCGDKACYEFKDAKKLLILDSDFDAMIQQNLAWAEQVKNLNKGVTQLTLALSAEKSAALSLQTSVDKLNEQLVKEVTRANTAEAKPGPFPAWAIGGGIGIAVGVVAGILLGVYVAKK